MSYFLIRSFLLHCRTLVLGMLLIFTPSGLPGSQTAAASPHYTVVSYTVSDGLPSDRIFSITTDIHGFLWCATGGGLARFDGLRWTTYPRMTGISALVTDASGVLRAAGNKGVFYFHQGKWHKQIPALADGENTRITCMAADARRGLWLGGNEKIFLLNHQNKFIAYPRDPQKQGNVIGIHVSPGGYVWCGTQNGVLLRFIGGGFKTNPPYKSGNNLPLWFYTLTTDGENFLWLGTNRGILKPEKDLHITSAHGLSNNKVHALLHHPDGTFWVGTENGLNRCTLNSDGIPHFRVLLPGLQCTALYRDPESNLWVGTHSSGLRKLRAAEFKTFSRQEGLPGKILSVFREDDNTIWAGTATNGLFRMENQRFVRVLDTNDKIKTMDRDAEGNFWIGTCGSGLLRIDRQGKHKVFTLKDGLLSDIFWAILADRENRVWIGAQKGLNLYQNGTFHSFTTQDGLLSNRVFNLSQDRQGRIWVMTDKGITVVEKGDFSRPPTYPLRDGIRTNAVYHDKSGVSWIGTYGQGLFRLEGDSLFRFHTGNGLADDFIHQILEELPVACGPKRLWLGSNKGIIRVNRDQLEAFAAQRTDSYHCRLYGTEHGLKSNKCSIWARNSALKTADGRLWFATEKGLSTIAPAETAPALPMLPVVVEYLEFKRHTYYPDGRPPMLRGGGTVEIGFNAPAFISPRETVFKYRLEEYDDSFRIPEPGEPRKAVYPHLPPGDYTFTVSVRNADGVWNPQDARFTFSVSRYFHQSPLFFILCFVLVSIIGFLIVRQRKRKPLPPEPPKKYSQALPDSVRIETILERLDQLMTGEKIYRDETLTLNTLAKKLDIPAHWLTRIINDKLDKRFNDYVNAFRIREAVQHLEGKKECNILNLAFDIGFNSKAAFYRAFKKFTGKTPGDYIK
ncbi:MAG: helix-turn-helix domain-containing protein [bacterium]|nr:helix-turn-helix domain-containing protein [bacterium]